MPSNTITLNTSFPPRSVQLVTGAGVLQSVKAHGPAIFTAKGSLPADPMRFDGGLPRYAADLNVDFYDGVSLSSAIRIFSMAGSPDSGPLSAAFSVGLLCVAKNENSLDVTYSN